MWQPTEATMSNISKLSVNKTTEKKRSKFRSPKEIMNKGEIMKKKSKFRSPKATETLLDCFCFNGGVKNSLTLDNSCS